MLYAFFLRFVIFERYFCKVTKIYLIRAQIYIL